MEINLGIKDDPKPTFLSAQLTQGEKETIQRILVEYIDCFTWSYKEIPCLDIEVAMRKLSINLNFSPVKQVLWKMKFDFEEKSIEETNSSRVHKGRKVPWLDCQHNGYQEKELQIGICMDFRDLSKVCRMDDFALHVMEIVIDNTYSYEMFSFIIGFSRCNQIKMDQGDGKHTTYRMLIGIYCYTVISFGLKNSWATYQRAITKFLMNWFTKLWNSM